MSIKSKNIKGFLVEKRENRGLDPKTCGSSPGWLERNFAWNECVDEQGKRSIGLNREKLAKKQYELLYPRLWEKEPWEEMIQENHIRIYCYKCADDIISDEADLIEYKGEE